MKIELIEFYPLERTEKKLRGSLRVRLPEIGIDLLGIRVLYSKGRWFFRLPGQKSVHHETGEAVFFPVVSFNDREKHKHLFEALSEQAPAFIEERVGKFANFQKVGLN